MRELRLSDRELAALIAPRLVARLKKAGFVSGMPSDGHNGFYFPIALDLAGEVHVCRHEDGTWVFEQHLDARLAERLSATEADHGQVIASAHVNFKGA